MKKESNNENPVWLRVKSIWKVLTSRNYILIHDIEKGVENKQPTISGGYICRTSLSSQDEIYALASIYKSLQQDYEAANPQ